MLCDLHKSSEHQMPKPHASHEDMMKMPKSAHEEKRDFHGNMKAIYAAGISPSLQEGHRKMAEMHANYVAATGVMGPGHKKKHEEKAKALHGQLSKSDLHKHEEGAHDGANDKEGLAPPNPDAEDNRTDDCNYCQDLDAVENADGTAGMHDCDMCSEYDAANGTTGGMDDCPACQEYDAANGTSDEMDDCPACAEYDAQNGSPEGDGCPACAEYDAAQGDQGLENISGAQDHPEQDVDHICNCPDCPKHDATALGVEDSGAQHPNDCPECNQMDSQAIENQPGQTGQEDPNMQGHETAEEVLGLLDQEPGAGGKTPAQEAKQIDNTEMPQGDAMEDGTSVTEDFGPAQKNNISDSDQQFQQQTDPGTSQDGPDMSSVLQSGLDDHQNEQKKAQVLDMVAQTLQGFKANKASLEASKEQNQGLYNSCIQMLKSMIELCKLMGLEPKMPEQAPPQAAPQAAPAGGPPQQAAPSEGAAEDPKAQAG